MYAKLILLLLFSFLPYISCSTLYAVPYLPDNSFTWSSFDPPYQEQGLLSSNGTLYITDISYSVNELSTSSNSSHQLVYGLIYSSRITIVNTSTDIASSISYPNLLIFGKAVMDANNTYLYILSRIPSNNSIGLFQLSTNTNIIKSGPYIYPNKNTNIALCGTDKYNNAYIIGSGQDGTLLYMNIMTFSLTNKTYNTLYSSNIQNQNLYAILNTYPICYISPVSNTLFWIDQTYGRIMYMMKDNLPQEFIMYELLPYNKFTGIMVDPYNTYLYCTISNSNILYQINIKTRDINIITINGLHTYYNQIIFDYNNQHTIYTLNLNSKNLWKLVDTIDLSVPNNCDLTGSSDIISSGIFIGSVFGIVIATVLITWLFAYRYYKNKYVPNNLPKPEPKSLPLPNAIQHKQHVNEIDKEQIEGLVHKPEYMPPPSFNPDCNSNRV